MKSQFRSFIDRESEERSSDAQQLNNPTDIEEQHRKNLFPQICSEQCEHKQCPYHNPDHYGQPCEMQWKPKETLPQLLPHTQHPTSYSKGYKLTQQIEKMVAKVFKPIINRIEALENQEKQSTIKRSSFNGKTTTRVDVGMNQPNINND